MLPALSLGLLSHFHLITQFCYLSIFVFKFFWIFDIYSADRVLHTWHYRSTPSTKPHLINTFCYTYTLSLTHLHTHKERDKPKGKDTPIRRKIMVSSWRWFVRSKVWRKPNFVFNTTEKVGPNQTLLHKHHIFKTLVQPLKHGTWRLFSAFVPQLSLPADVSPNLTAFSLPPYFLYIFLPNTPSYYNWIHFFSLKIIFFKLNHIFYMFLHQDQFIKPSPTDLP